MKYLLVICLTSILVGATVLPMVGCGSCGAPKEKCDCEDCKVYRAAKAKAAASGEPAEKRIPILWVKGFDNVKELGKYWYEFEYRGNTFLFNIQAGCLSSFEPKEPKEPTTVPVGPVDLTAPWYRK